jgi:hypothetical protein
MDHTPTDLKDISKHFQQVKFVSQDKFTCCCPVHSDKSPSAYVYLNKGWINLGCSSGCDKSDLRRYISDLGYNKKKSKPGPRSVKKAPRKKDSDGYKMLMPVPKKYMDHWRTLMNKLHNDIPHNASPNNYIFPYLDLSNKYHMIIARKDRPDGGKDFLPYTLWEKDGHVIWKNKGPSQPKPLYIKGLHSYEGVRNLKHVDTVHIYEGEKTTNAGARIFKENKNILHVTWQGGSQNTHTANWKELLILKDAGANIKTIVLFPDNDAPGYDAMKSISVLLVSLFETRDIRQLDLTAFPDKWDVADVTEGTMPELTKAYENAELVELPTYKEFTYIREIDSFYDWQQQMFYKSDHFTRILMTDTVFGDDGHPIQTSKGFIKAENTDKADKITFDPQNKKRFREGGTVYVNTYEPYNVAPVTGNYTLLDQFFEYIAPDPNNRKYLIQWLAHNIRYPGVKIMTALLIYGVEGIGKGTVYQILRALLGKDNVKQAKEEEFKDKFTEFLYRRVVLFIDEIKVEHSNRHSMMNKIKMLITEDEFVVDMKGLRPFYTKNVCNFGLLSNYDNAITITDKSRRFFILGVLTDPMPGPWYKAIYELIRENPGIIKSYFDKVDLSDFDRFAHAPKTEYFEEVLENTKAEDHRILDTYWDEKRPPFSPDSDFVVIEDLRSCFAKLGIKFSTRVIQDWIKKRGGKKLCQVRFGKHRPVIWTMEPNKPTPTEPKDIAKMYLQPYWESPFDPNNIYFLTLEDRRTKDGFNAIDVSQTKHHF